MNTFHYLETRDLLHDASRQDGDTLSNSKQKLELQQNKMSIIRFEENHEMYQQL